MKTLLFTAALFALVHLSVQEVEVQVDIDTNSSTSLTDNLSPELQQANLTQGYIESITKKELIVELCPKGTFSRDAACVGCPTGTASPAEGASNDMTCGACSAGSFAGASASACANCATNTFSTTYKASSSSQCIGCPPDTTSATGSDNVRSCVCNKGLFVSNNLVSAIDSATESLGFEGAAGIDLPHVLC